MRWFIAAMILASSPLAFAETAVFAGGCFWCMEPPFEKLDGVSKVISGYTGGSKDNPTYEEVSSGSTGHRESVEITYDPKKVTYAKLLEVFWKNIDPYDERGQFCDKGEQYKSAVYYKNDDEKKAFEKSLEDLKKSGKLKDKVATEAMAFKKFWPAEEYHQDYYKKNPIRYKFYRGGCGRDKRLKEVWGG